MTVKTKYEIEKMRFGGTILAKVMQALVKIVAPGLKTRELDDLATRKIKEYGAQASFLNYQGFPGSICTSINEEIVHGIPSERQLFEGDLLGIDLGIFYDGYHTDAAVTVGVGKLSQRDTKLMEIAQKSLLNGLKKVKNGAKIGDIASVVQRTAEKAGFSVVRDLTGHGIGRDLHEDPSIPNFGDPQTGEVIKSGQTLAIEPMINAGTYHTVTLDDGWTIVTEDRKKSAHFELTILVTDHGYENLTPIRG